MGTVVTTEQKVEVKTVKDVVVTTIEQLETGDYVREIRVMTQDDDEQQPSQAFVLRLVGETLGALHISTPASEF
jgi:hypothetical protein